MSEWVIWPTRSQRHFAAVPFKLTKDLTDGYGWYVYHSNDYAFCSAIGQCVKMIEGHVVQIIEEGVSKLVQTSDNE